MNTISRISLAKPHSTAVWPVLVLLVLSVAAATAFWPATTSVEASAAAADVQIQDQTRNAAPTVGDPSVPDISSVHFVDTEPSEEIATF